MPKVNDTAKDRAKFILSQMSQDEEAAINLGIANDPDNTELTEEDFARMRPASEVVPEIVARYKQERVTKKAISIRLSADVLAYFKAKGKGWQTLIDETLRKAAGL